MPGDASSSSMPSIDKGYSGPTVVTVVGPLGVGADGVVGADGAEIGRGQARRYHAAPPIPYA